jgi:hypothetical protein
MIIYVDIDETICEYETSSDEERDYSKAIPIKSNISVINKLYDEENEIVYWTARGSTTGIDWSELTTNQLKKWDAKHHKVLLGKPHYDLFICDKAINSLSFFKENSNKGKIKN